jgi:hypothetical protein
MLFSGRDLHSAGIPSGEINYSVHQDTVLNRQKLYNGQLWRNIYSSISGDQFFLTDKFLPGTIQVSNHLFSGVELKYDICSDQLLILKDSKEIIQVNKELVDFFSLTTANEVYSFINVTDDTLKYFKGYMNELYNGRSALYVKYLKVVENIITGRYLGKFNETRYIFIKRDEKVWPVKNLTDASRALNTERSVLKSYLKKNKLRVTKKNPESFIPLLQFSDGTQGN